MPSILKLYLLAPVLLTLAALSCSNPQGPTADPPDTANTVGSLYVQSGPGFYKFADPSWQVMALPTNGLGSLVVCQGSIYSGRGGDLSRWDGGNWTTVSSQGSSIVIIALGVYQEKLIMDESTGASGNLLRQWNGSQLEGINQPPYSRRYTDAFAEYNGSLYAAGAFWIGSGNYDYVGVVRWNGSSWSTPDTIRGFWGYALCVFNGELYVAGYISGSSDGQVLKYNGSSWSQVGHSFDNGGGGAFGIFKGQLYVGGGFKSNAGVPMNNIARWDGSAWQPLGAGVSGNERYVGVRAIVEYKGQLYVGGTFTSAGGVAGANGIARWDGANWTGLGMNMDDNVGSFAVAAP